MNNTVVSLMVEDLDTGDIVAEFDSSEVAETKNFLLEFPDRDFVILGLDASGYSIRAWAGPNVLNGLMEDDLKSGM